MNLLRSFVLTGRVLRPQNQHLRPTRALRLVACSESLRPFKRNMSSEATKSETATDSGEPTIFDKIIQREIPSDIVLETDSCIAFRDVSPQAPTHILVIPKVRDGLTRLANAEERHKAVLGELMYTASLVAKQENLGDGYRVVVNDGKNGCQSVYHLHLHVIGGRKLGWPPG